MYNTRYNISTVFTNRSVVGGCDLLAHSVKRKCDVCVTCMLAYRYIVFMVM